LNTNTSCHRSVPYPNIKVETTNEKNNIIHQVSLGLFWLRVGPSGINWSKMHVANDIQQRNFVTNILSVSNNRHQNLKLYLGNRLVANWSRVKGVQTTTTNDS